MILMHNEGGTAALARLSGWTRILLCTAGFFLPTINATARLGDTLDQAEAHFGLEKKPRLPGGTAKLLEGSREVLFEYEGWRIRCALLQATDGSFYVVREEYTKILNADWMKNGGTPQIRDFERDAILKAEGGEWSPKLLAKRGPDLLSSAANQLVHTFGLINLSMRSDGALLRTNLGGLNMILDLPQALNYEAQLKGIKDQQQRQNAQRLFQPQSQTDPPGELPQTPSSASPSQARPLPQSGSAPPAVPAPEPFSAPAIPRPPVQNIRPSIPQANLPFGTLTSFVVLIGIVSAARLALGKKSKRSVSPRKSSPSPESQTSKPQNHRSPAPLSPSINSQARSVKDLTWDEFELLVGEIYRRQGFTVELSAGTGADGGIDLILHRDGQRTLVQCKAWNSYKVGAKEIREFFGVMTAENASCGIFVTTGEFTRDARDFAAGKRIELINGPAFEAMLKTAALGPDDDLLNVSLWAQIFLGASRVTIPHCPKCKAKMVKRQGPSGAFLGCPTFPRCNGTREIRSHVHISDQ